MQFQQPIVKQIILSGESDDNCPHNNFYLMVYNHKIFDLKEKPITLLIRK